LQIHVVQRGETVWGISQWYGVSPAELIEANQLPNPDRLVVGQALVVPIVGQYHYVRPGESLWQIGRRYGISPQRLAQVNRIASPESLAAGTVLYIPPGPKPYVEANGFYQPSGEPAERETVESLARNLTYVTMFEYRIQRDGTIVPLDDQAAREGARAGGAASLMALTNVEEGRFSEELAGAVLGSANIQDRLIGEIIRLLRERGFRGVNFDFEHLRPADREAYNRFLERAAQRIRSEGFTVSTALAPKLSREQVGFWYEAHDYPAHGEIVDFVILMTYEWGWSGGPPMAVAPINQVRRVLDYALTEMPPHKILMGIPLYGYDWTLPYRPGGPFARAISPQEAIRLAARFGPDIQYDWQSQSPFFRYWDEEGREHEVWFEDARSIQAKFDLVKELGLRGVSYWKLDFAFPQNWLLLRDNFTLRRES
jgi:spore germination protein